MSRNNELKTQRRRRNSEALGGARQRLVLDEAKLDKEKYAYYWASSTPGRIEALTQQDDWEIVPDRSGTLKADGSGMGSEVSIHAGVTASGAAERLVLLRKPKAYHDEDAKAAQRQIDETERGLKQANLPNPGGAQGSAFYSEQSGIRIENGAAT